MELLCLLNSRNTEDISGLRKTLNVKTHVDNKRTPHNICNNNNVLVHENTLRCIVSPDYYLGGGQWVKLLSVSVSILLVTCGH